MKKLINAIISFIKTAVKEVTDEIKEKWTDFEKPNKKGGVLIE